MSDICFRPVATVLTAGFLLVLGCSAGGNFDESQALYREFSAEKAFAIVEEITALGPRIIFATPPGERHELGLHMAALTAMGAGAQAIYLGADMPTDELVRAIERTRAVGLGLSVVTLPEAEAEQALAELAASIPSSVRVWIGGRLSPSIAVPAQFEQLESLDDFERRIALVGYDQPASNRR